MQNYFYTVKLVNYIVSKELENIKTLA